MSQPYLNREEFTQIVRLTPLVSIDLILRDRDGYAMLGLRNNEPAKGTYFVPGGVIRKDEKIAQAFARILKGETGLEIPITNTRLLGAYEHFYATNRFDEKGYGTHYVVLAHELRLQSRPDIRLDDQHRQLVWWTPDQILARAEVHDYTKAYFRQSGSQSIL